MSGSVVRANFQRYLSTSNYDSFEIQRSQGMETASTREPPYHPDNTKIEKSISLHAWNQIAEWRAEKAGSLGRKFIAELGYLGSGITGIVELPFRVVAAYTIGNSLSQLFAKMIFCDEEERYRQIKNTLDKSVDETIQGIAQNFTSIGTNLVSHELNMTVSRQVKRDLDGSTQKIVKAVEAISPFSIFEAIAYKNTSGILYDINNHIGEGNGIEPPDPRTTTNIIRLSRLLEKDVP
jgi:hypothetical protein